MSVSLCGNMRGPQVKTTLLLLLLFLTSLTGTVYCTEEEPAATEETDSEVTSTLTPLEPVPGQEEGNSGNSETTEATREEPHNDNIPDEDTESSGSGSNGDTLGTEMSTDAPNEDEGSSLLIILIIVVHGVVLIGIIVGGILFHRQRNKKVINQELSKEDPYLEGSSEEKVPMPMFEEDVPSVQELEMEELDQWMKKDNSSTAS